MKAMIDIPDNIAIAHAKSPLSRRQIESDFNLSEYHAKVMNYILNHSKLLHGGSIRTAPRPGDVSRALILPDMHIPFHCEKSLNAALNFGAKKGADIVVILGDGVDAVSLKWFRGHPKNWSLKREVEESIPVLWSIRDAFSDCELIHIEGNHELRLRNYIWNEAKAFADLPTLSIPVLYELDKMGWEYISVLDMRRQEIPPPRLGKLFLIHGHEVPISSGSVNPARILYQKSHNNVMSAHWHWGTTYAEKKLDGTIETAIILDCLCELHPEDWNPKRGWFNGFGYVTWDSDGYFSSRGYRMIDGRIL